MRAIILNEWKTLFRARTFLYLTVFFVAALITVSWISVEQNRSQRKQQFTAHKHVRGQWESIDAMNTHSAAHYGSYIFKPITLLSSIDEGINSATGNVLRLEGHAQNEMAYSEASQSLTISKFGKLNPALLLQYVVPLLLIFLSFTTVSSERESTRLKLLVLQGSTIRQIILGKAFSIWLYSVFLLLITVGSQVAVDFKQIDLDTSLRMCMLLLSYSMYYYIITLASTWFSARLKSNVASLSLMLSIWVLWTIFLPKIWGSTVDQIYPLPSRQEFKNVMQEDRSKGLDGHNPADKRAEAFKQEVLARYKVNTLEELPINYDGLRMQADEEYGNSVWEKHFGQNFKILQQQKTAYQVSGFFNPFASLNGASMGFCGSDMQHHLSFLRQAEDYRRYLIKTLNEKQAYGGSKTGDWSWTEDSEFYKSVKDFEYNMPVLRTMLSFYILDLLILVLWGGMITFLIMFQAKKIDII